MRTYILMLVVAAMTVTGLLVPAVSRADEPVAAPAVPAAGGAAKAPAAGARAQPAAAEKGSPAAADKGQPAGAEKSGAVGGDGDGAATVINRGPTGDDPIAGTELTPQVLAATERGLEFLAKSQAADGSYGQTGGYSGHVGITALAGLAFLSHGDVPGRGKYGQNVEKCLEYILSHCGRSGFIAGGSVSHGPMYEHGFATLFLAEVYGMSPKPELHEKLSKAVDLIVKTQNKEGGWRYQPVKFDADLSVTICSVMALRAARNNGIKVPKETIDLAIDYVKKSQESDGGFRYTLQAPGSLFPRSAAGVCALFNCGIYSGPEVDKGLKYLLQRKPGRPGSENSGHYYYGHYYAAQAMFIAGGNYWKEWWPAISKELLSKQSANGAWSGEAGTEYATAMAGIILQIPNRYLPILQR